MRRELINTTKQLTCALFALCLSNTALAKPNANASLEDLGFDDNVRTFATQSNITLPQRPKVISKEELAAARQGKIAKGKEDDMRNGITQCEANTSLVRSAMSDCLRMNFQFQFQ